MFQENPIFLQKFHKIGLTCSNSLPNNSSTNTPPQSARVHREAKRYQNASFWIMNHKLASYKLASSDHLSEKRGNISYPNTQITFKASMSSNRNPNNLNIEERKSGYGASSVPMIPKVWTVLTRPERYFSGACLVCNTLRY